MDAHMNSNPPAGDMQPNIYAALLITVILATSAVALRFLCRRLVGTPLWLDDWLTLVALCTTIGFDINIYILAKNGVGRHVENINQDSTTIYYNFFLGLWIAELFYSFALTPAKLAFLAFYWRIFKVSSITRPIMVIAIVILCWLIVRVVVTICHCIPVQGYWDKSIEASCNVDDQKFFVGSVIPHLLMDLIILVLPVPYIKSLQITLYQKFCVFAMFLLGGFICFASVIQVVVCFKLDATSPDVTWTFAPIAIWATVEVNLAVVAACLPSLRPIYRMVMNRSLKSIHSSQQNTHHSVSRTWNGQSTLQGLTMFKSTYSESTKQLADTEGEGSRGFGDPFVDASSRRSDTTCEADNIVLGQIHAHQAGQEIMVKNEVNVKISASDRPHITNNGPRR